MAAVRQIGPELAIIARDELNEVESRIVEGITTLREWIQKQPHLKARTDDQFLLTFLRGSKHSIEIAKRKLDFYYTIKSLSPEYFRNTTVDANAMQLARLGHFVPLSKPLKVEGPRIYLTRFNGMDPHELNIVDIARFQLRIYDINMHEDDNTIIGGIVTITDFASLSLRYLLQFDPNVFKKFATFADKAVPFRFKSLHVINIPKEAVPVINICRNMLPPKISSRLFVHTTIEDLYDHIPREYLPEEYGGSNGRIQDPIDYWAKHILEYNNFFEEELQYGVNEQLRVGRKVTTESLFGLDGSFRKLEVD